MKGKPQLIAPELVDPRARRWRMKQVDLRESGVDLEAAIAYVPESFTPAQQLARLHELGHVKYTPNSQADMVSAAMRYAEENGDEIDPGVALRISKMIEENRIDWLLWRVHGIDLRSCREALDWSGMPVPDDALNALEWVFQLAWTVWASRGLGAQVSHPPPVRTTDPETAEYFDTCWKVVLDHPEGRHIATTIVRTCTAIYRRTSATAMGKIRDRTAAEIATYFKPKPQAQPDEKEEEKEEQKRAKQQKQNKIEAEERAKEEVETGGIGNEPTARGIVQVHDHTAGIRRPSVRVARRDRPYSQGTRFQFPERYLLDQQIFGKRTLTEAGIMVDISQSMAWTNDSLQEVLSIMPAVWVGAYGGFRTDSRFWGSGRSPEDRIYGRICILAKRGRFCRYDGKDPGFTGSNDVDVEALEYLSKWPHPRLWLSDGYVGGGPRTGQSHPEYKSEYLDRHGLIVYECNRIMKRHGILRVPDLPTMMQLVRRRPVTLYRSCVNITGMYKGLNAALQGVSPVSPADQLRVRRSFYPDQMREEPCRFQL